MIALAMCAGVRADDEAVRAERPTFPGEIIKKADIKPQFGKQIPLDAEFTTADGKKVKLGELLTDKPVILHFVYYDCPMLCKLSSDGLLSTLTIMSLEPGKDFTIITLSFAPNEGPEFSAKAREMMISRYGKERVDAGWHFLTGADEAIRSVTDTAGFFYVYDENTRQYAHGAGLFILTPRGKVSRFLGGINYTLRDMRLALVDASDGKVGSVGDQVMLLCYMYDPTTGKYGFAIMSVIRLAGLLTVALLAGSIITMVRRERRRDSLSQALEAPYTPPGFTQ